jgi:hypothetical protein
MRKASAKAALLLVGGTIVLAVLTLAWAMGAGSSEAQQGAMHNCPQPGRWAISVWGGADGTEAGEALAACGQDAVEVAYYIDPDTQQWLGYFAGHADISQLLVLNGKQGVIARGAAAATSGSLAVPGATYVGTTSQGLAIEFEVSADGLAIKKVKYRASGKEPGGETCETFTTSSLGPSTVGTVIVDNSFAIVHTQFDMSGHFETQWQATGELTVHELQADNVPPCDAGPLTWTATIPSATPTAVPSVPGQMQNCPQAGKWAISVWDGPDGTETGEALATCGAVPVIAAYHLDPATNGWLGYFEGRPEATKLLTLDYRQGVIALGGTAVQTPAPTATPSSTPSPTATATPTPTPTPTATACPEAECEAVSATYQGNVLLEGQPAEDGTVVTAWIEDFMWGWCVTSGGQYSCDVPHVPSEEPPCFEGGQVVFFANILECTPSVQWEEGSHNLDLACS